MSSYVQTLERDLREDPDRLDDFFAQDLSVSELILGAVKKGYRIGLDELLDLKAPERKSSLAADLYLRVPTLDGRIEELAIHELDLVAAAGNPYLVYANVAAVGNVAGVLAESRQL